MQIAGIQKLTLVDFPGRVAATVFTRGCSFRCGFCHNPELVIPKQFIPLLDEQKLFDFLETRYGKLTGICITGGEPLLQNDIEQFISHLKAIGFDVKLDTNGSFPEKLERIIKTGDIDYIAMDIKNSLSKYAQTAIPNSKFPISNQIPNHKAKKESHDSLSLRGGGRGGEGDLTKKIQRSIDLIMSSGIPYEFRTTVSHPLHEVADFHEIGKLIEGADKYFIQNFVKSKQLDPAVDFMPFSDSEIEQSLDIMTHFVKEASVR
jgi:pyruvate formate lyase activating enzyme